MAFTDKLAATESTLRAQALLRGSQAFELQRAGLPAPLESVEALGFKLAANTVHLLRNVVKRPNAVELAEIAEEPFLGMQYVDLPPTTDESVAEIQEKLAFQYDNGTEN